MTIRLLSQPLLTRGVGRALRQSFGGHNNNTAAATTTTAVGQRWTSSSKTDTTLQAEHVKQVFRSMAMQDDEVRNELSYSLAFATNQNDEDSGAWQYLSMVSNPTMRRQLETARNQCVVDTHSKDNDDVVQQVPQQETAAVATPVVDEPLPHTLSEAMRPTRQAMVITECQAPFKVWNVNKAWEELCGYTFVESRGQTLGALLQGPATDTIAATNLVAKLLQGETEVGTTLTNYTKTGRPFQNRIRVGPIYDEENGDRITHFVGILQEVGKKTSHAT